MAEESAEHRPQLPAGPRLRCPHPFEGPQHFRLADPIDRQVEQFRRVPLQRRRPRPLFARRQPRPVRVGDLAGELAAASTPTCAAAPREWSTDLPRRRESFARRNDFRRRPEVHDRRPAAGDAQRLPQGCRSAHRRRLRAHQRRRACGGRGRPGSGSQAGSGSGPGSRRGEGCRWRPGRPAGDRGEEAGVVGRAQAVDEAADEVPPCSCLTPHHRGRPTDPRRPDRPGPGIQRGAERLRRARVFHDGTDASQLRDRHRPPPLATAKSIARDRAAPARGRLSCPAGQPAVVEGADVNWRTTWEGTLTGGVSARSRLRAAAVGGHARRREPPSSALSPGPPPGSGYDGVGQRTAGRKGSAAAERRSGHLGGAPAGDGKRFQWPARCGGGSLGGSRSRCRGSKSWTRCAMRSGR